MWRTIRGRINLIPGPMPVIERIAATVEAYSDAVAEDFRDLDDDRRHVVPAHHR